MATAFAGATAWCQAARVPAGCTVGLAIDGNGACPRAVTGMGVVTLDSLPPKRSHGVSFSLIACLHTLSGCGQPGTSVPRRVTVVGLDGYCSAMSTSRAATCGRRGCLHGSGSASVLLWQALHAGEVRWCLPPCVTEGAFHGVAGSRTGGRDGAGGAGALGGGEGHD